MIAFIIARVLRAVVSAAVLFVVVALVATTFGEVCAPTSLTAGVALCTHPSALEWLGGALHLDLGRTTDGRLVTDALALAFGPTIILVVAALVISFVVGWIGGALLALADTRNSWPARSGIGRFMQWSGRLLGRVVTAVTAIGQGVPVFWIGSLLIAVFAIGLGLVPPGGIVSPALPPFGTSDYLAALQASPLNTLADLSAHLVLPAVTLALVGLSTDLRLVRVVLPVEMRTHYTHTGRALGLPRRRVAGHAVRPALPLILGPAAASTPLFLSALVLVEYLFGWPGLGLLAYQAATTGDAATLSALTEMAGLAVIAIGVVADVIAAWADPRLRQRTRRAAA